MATVHGSASVDALEVQVGPASMFFTSAGDCVLCGARVGDAGRRKRHLGRHCAHQGMHTGVFARLDGDRYRLVRGSIEAAGALAPLLQHFMAPDPAAARGGAR